MVDSYKPVWLGQNDRLQQTMEGGCYEGVGNSLFQGFSYSKAQSPTIHNSTYTGAKPLSMQRVIADTESEYPFVCPQVPAVSFIGRSGVGKTTLLLTLVAELKNRGFKVGALKHGPPSFEIDHPGKDSYRLSQAGADSMLVASDNKLALVKQYQEPPAMEELLAQYFPDVDIVLVEGFKQADLPRIVIHRSTHNSEPLCGGEREQNAFRQNLLAVATDCELQIDVPQFDLNAPEALVDFLLTTYALC